MSLAEGTVVGSYRILGKLGEGGMGTVYRAVDTMIHREVAVKALRPEIASQPDVMDRFRSEAVLLAKLNHPAIAQLYAFFNEGGQSYMVMEYVAGDTFERVIQQQGAMEWPRAFSLTLQILEGIGHAHAAGILHRDLKPANVMLTPAGRIKLMDFGIAQALGAARMTRQGRIIGTLEYLAPERIQGKPADTRSDLYSVGVMLFEMLSGRLPFQSDSEYELLQQQVQKAPPEFGSLGVRVPADVESAVRKALEKNPERRYAAAEEFSAALTELLTGGKTASPAPLVQESSVPIAAAAAPAAGSQLQSLTAKPVFWLAAAGTLVVLALGIVFAALRTHQPPPPVTVAESTQPQIYQPPSNTTLTTTPSVVVPPTPSEPAPAPPPPKPANDEPVPSKPRVTTPVRTESQPVPQPTPPPAPVPAPVQAAPPTTVAERTPPPLAPVAAPPPATGGLVRLSDAHSIFVAGSESELDGYVREEIQRQLGGRVRVARSLADADVVMRVTLDEQKGKGIAQAGRIFGVKDHAQVRAVVFDAHTSHVIWQQGAGDRKLIVGSFRGESVKRLAERIVKELRDSFNR
jgi:tRNA A-37 threonylcarbamoyl transferase component Bud32